MASHHKFHQQTREVLPHQAVYNQPTQSTKIFKSTVKIPPKNGSSFLGSANPTIRFEIPATGYLNGQKSYISIDFSYLMNFSQAPTGTTWTSPCRLNYGIQSCFRRLRLLYGSLVIEDEVNYDILVRKLMIERGTPSFHGGSANILEAAPGPAIARQQTFSDSTQNQIFLNTYSSAGGSGNADLAGNAGAGNVGNNVTGYRSLIQKKSTFMPPFLPNVSSDVEMAASALLSGSNGNTAVGTVSPSNLGAFNLASWYGIPFTPIGSGGQSRSAVRNMNCILLSGLLNQPKLIPLKWMSASLILEIELQNPIETLVTMSQFPYPGYGSVTSTSTGAGAPNKPNYDRIDGSGAILNTNQSYAAQAFVNQTPFRNLIDGPCLAYLSNGSVNLSGAQPTTWYTAGSTDALVLTSVDYILGNPNLVMEILEFDDTYDISVRESIKQNGLPIAYSSWHSFQTTINGTNNFTPIQEKSRSIKAGFATFMNNNNNAIVKLKTPAVTVTGDYNYTAAYAIYDNKQFYFSPFGTGSNILTFQWRIGGRYYPSQPVSCINGATEAYVELLKALKMAGVSNQTPNIYLSEWTDNFAQTGPITTGNTERELEGLVSAIDVVYPGNSVIMTPRGQHPNSASVQEGNSVSTTDEFTQNSDTTGANAAVWTPAHKFIVGTEFESTNGFEISGINAQEQSDIYLQTTFAQINGITTSKIVIFINYDGLIIIRDGNVVDKID